MQVQGAGARVERFRAAPSERVVEGAEEGETDLAPLVVRERWDGPERRRRRRRASGRPGGRRAGDLPEPQGRPVDVDVTVDLVAARQAALARQATLARQTSSTQARNRGAWLT